MTYKNLVMWGTCHNHLDLMEPLLEKTNSKVFIKASPTIFVCWGVLDDESIEDISSWVYKGAQVIVTVPIEKYTRGLHIVKNMS